ncbi:hypothetical protein HK098_007311 [Nowakowskiella sp. JEL0407]|nr:hypothetical protein HK098_007311 [Nowakowskiella sp. JEL0407]
MSTHPVIGTPTITYFDFGNKGRGEIVRLFFHAAGIKYIDSRISFADWPAKKAELLQSGASLVGAIPVVTINGKEYSQSVPILRYLSKVVGKFGGKDVEEEFAIDQLADMYIDWRFSWVGTLRGDEKEKEKHAASKTKFYSAFEQIAAKNGGPYMIGSELTYADVAIYQALHDDDSLDDRSELAAKYPKLAAFVEAFEKRPEIAEYLEFRKQYAPKK